MSEPKARQCSLVIIDSRNPDEEPLSLVLREARVAYQITLVARSDRVLDVVRAERPLAVLGHAGFEARPKLPAVGPLLAALCRRFDPDLPILMYTGNPSAGYEATLSQLGVSAPVVLDRRLSASFAGILADLVDHGAADQEVQRSFPPLAHSSSQKLPENFRIDRFLPALRGALLRSALHEHSSRTLAASALGLPIETFLRQLREQNVEMPHAPRRESTRGPSLLWCSDQPPPPWVTARCDEGGLGVRAVPPGTLHPSTVGSIATTGAVVDPADPGSVLDAWLLHRAGRPFLLARQPSVQFCFLIEELGVSALLAVDCGQFASGFLRAGRCVANLFLDERPLLRSRFDPQGRAAWPVDARSLLQRVDSRLLRHAQRTTGSAAAAARAVGLPEPSYRRRLRVAASS